MRTMAAAPSSNDPTAIFASGLFSARPAASAADFYHATDVGDNGCTFWSNGTIWMPIPCILTNQAGVTATPATQIQTSVNAAGSTLFTKNDGTTRLIPVMPAGLLVANRSRLRVTFNLGHTGIGTTTFYWKIGTLGTTGDSSISSTGVTGTAQQRMSIDVIPITAGQVISNGNAGYSSSGTGHTEAPATLTLSSALYLSIGTTGLAATDNAWLFDVMVELLA